MIAEYGPVIVNIWLSGGWVMVPLLLVSLFIYGLAAHLLWTITGEKIKRHSDTQLKLWIEHPERSEGEIGNIIRYAHEDSVSLDDIHSRYSEVMTARIPAIERRLVLMNIMVSAAPLLGLLGTVLGMLKTFQAISVGTGKTVDLVAQGISEALITTEMGLLIAIPGYFLAYVIKRKKDEYAAFLARLESFSLLEFQKKGGLT
ncbi:MAG TPA: hypothetical protein DCY13_04620 [Verrucomicrobiales bacterium]|nr:hypothetical protein [Verrucomicrobiales bacterium]